MALSDNAQAVIGLAAVGLLAAVLAGGFYLLVRPDPPPPPSPRAQETWCTGFAAGQVVIGTQPPLGMGKPSFDEFDSIVLACLDLGYPERPLSIYLSEEGVPEGGGP